VAPFPLVVLMLGVAEVWVSSCVFAGFLWGLLWEVLFCCAVVVDLCTNLASVCVVFCVGQVVFCVGRVFLHVWVYCWCCLSCAVLFVV